MKKLALSLMAASLFVFSGCRTTPRVELTPDQVAIVEDLELDQDKIAELEAKPLYEFKESELGDYLAFVQRDEPDLRKRIVRLGRKNINQPYELHLLGEAPFETYDPQPLYCLDRSDCVVFSEHTYAMAMSDNWESFFTLLQRIRYKDGQIGVATRNHYTEADWDVNNDWLVTDISSDLAGDDVATYPQKIDRSRFLRKRYKLVRDIPVEKLEVEYVPWDKVADIEDQLQSGDYVNVIVGTTPTSAWATHVGLIAVDDDGTVNFLHSTPPRVREEPIQTYIKRGVDRMEKRKAEGKSYLLGFKFLRLQENPIENLKKIDGPEGPKISVPDGSILAAK